MGDTRGRMGLWTASRHADAALALLADALRRPRFQEDRLRRTQDALTDALRHRGDDPELVLADAFAEAIYGDHPLAWRETAASIAAASAEALRAFHRRHVRPDTVVIAVAGDLEREAMARRLEDLLGDWRADGDPPETALPPVRRRAKPSVLHRPMVVNQGFVQLGHVAVALDHPDVPALEVMDWILGSGSFTSRVPARVRNEEGLAYSAGSYFAPGLRNPGALGLFFQTKVASVARGVAICLEEARRIRSRPVSKGELRRAKEALRDAFPERFATAAQAAATLAEVVYAGLPDDHLEGWLARVEGMTAEEVLRAACAHLRLEELAAVVVGPPAAAQGLEALLRRA